MRTGNGGRRKSPRSIKEKMREILNNVSDLENNNKVSISIDINPC